MSTEAIAGRFLENAKGISDTRPHVHDIDVTDPDESISKALDDIKAHKSVLQDLAGVFSRISEQTVDAWTFHERSNIWVSLTEVCDELKSYYTALEEKAFEAKKNASNANAISDELVNLQKKLKLFDNELPLARLLDVVEEEQDEDDNEEDPNEDSKEQSIEEKTHIFSLLADEELGSCLRS